MQFDEQMEMAFVDTLGYSKHFIWSKENPIWRLFFRTKVAGAWSKEDRIAFVKFGYRYEIHLDHSKDELAQIFSLRVLERCDHFMAARVSKLALNDMKVIVFAGDTLKMRDKISHLARLHGFELARIRTGQEQPSENELHARRKVAEYINAVHNTFAPNFGMKVPYNDS